jgi:hypothetical protein
MPIIETAIKQPIEVRAVDPVLACRDSIDGTLADPLQPTASGVLPISARQSMEPTVACPGAMSAHDDLLEKRNDKKRETSATDDGETSLPVGMRA